MALLLPLPGRSTAQTLLIQFGPTRPPLALISVLYLCCLIIVARSSACILLGLLTVLRGPFESVMSSSLVRGFPRTLPTLLAYRSPCRVIICNEPSAPSLLLRDACVVLSAVSMKALRRCRRGSVSPDGWRGSLQVTCHQFGRPHFASADAWGECRLEAQRRSSGELGKGFDKAIFAWRAQVAIYEGAVNWVNREAPKGLLLLSTPQCSEPPVPCIVRPRGVTNLCGCACVKSCTLSRPLVSGRPACSIGVSPFCPKGPRIVLVMSTMSGRSQSVPSFIGLALPLGLTRLQSCGVTYCIPPARWPFPSGCRGARGRPSGVPAFVPSF